MDLCYLSLVPLAVFWFSTLNHRCTEVNSYQRVSVSRFSRAMFDSTGHGGE